MKIEDDHVRYQRYLKILSEAKPLADHEIIDMILDDSDQIMAESTLTQYIDRIGSSHPDFVAWSVKVSPLLTSHEFLLRRISEWQLYRELVQGNLINLTQLVNASNWLQRKVVKDIAIVTALETLTKDGRTKAVRNTAKSRLQQRYR